MIDRKNLLTELQKLVRDLEDDLRERCDADEQVMEHLRTEWSKAKQAKRTADGFEAWRDGKGKQSGRLTEVAAAWALACVFVRFLEDNDLIAPPRLGGPSDRMQHARDERTAYAQREPLHNDAQYLEWVFNEAAKLPALGDVLGDRHNPLWTLRLSPDGGKKLLRFWQQRDDESGDVRWDFTDPEWDTRFLGDLYQDLSEAARKRYALLQTPDFIEEFILDRTLEPACEEFGYREVRMIDPACGSGHFLLGTFDRLFRRWAKDQPGEKPTVLAQRALDAVHGVDINPFAVAIARFRLLVAAMSAAGVRRMADAPTFQPHLATGDSLLHGPILAGSGLRGVQRALSDWLDDAHIFETEDSDALRQVLGQRYHVVVGNPPYITPKDAALNAAYRQRYGSCSGKYALSVPFMERMFDLAITPERGQRSPAGFVGQITSNSFMKREFGRRLVERYLSAWDLSLVIDCSGVHIPAHGTPTVIVIGRSREPIGDSIRAVLGIRAEPAPPEVPARGLVWQEVRRHVDRPGREGRFVGVQDLPRETFSEHPWSLKGGGAMELKTRIEGTTTDLLQSLVAEIGRSTHTGLDPAFFLPNAAVKTRRLEGDCVPSVLGDQVRDYHLSLDSQVLFPYDRESGASTAEQSANARRHYWSLRVVLQNRRDFGRTPAERGLRWFDHSMFFPKRYATPLGIAFPDVATHNHFVLDDGEKVFNRTAPVVKLPGDATRADHVGLLGVLNSSTACFLLKQVCHNKGGGGIGGGIASEHWEQFYVFNAGNLSQLALPTARPAELAERLQSATEALADAHARVAVADVLEQRSSVENSRDLRDERLAMAVALQEEVDWLCYGLYGLEDEPYCLDCDPPRVELGQRAFEIVMARRMFAGELQTRWFERHGSTPTTEVPPHWPEAYRRLVERRIRAIESNESIRLIEQPEYKRRWNTEPWEKQFDSGLREWLLDRMEDRRLWSETTLQSCSRLADRLRHDDEFLRAAELYTGRADHDLTKIVESLVAGESVPFLAGHRYKPSGLRKREQWQRAWDLQRAEDAIDARTELPEGAPEHLTHEQVRAKKRAEIGDIPVPPKYASKDFQNATYWRLRGKLDVPKERFISYPGAERDADRTLVVTWAGLDHLEQATALATYYHERKESDGWQKDKLVPLLAGVLELVPWLKQWHNEIDPEFHQRMGDYFADFVDAEAAALGVTLDDLRNWRPPAKTRGRKKKGT